ncbi:beta-mannosidase [Nocardia brasiliensis]|uniref:beta-mannosidase n=1 Tax=Nocardia brasiliensis TaxID=37326 RepID=UPI003D8B6AD3
MTTARFVAALLLGTALTGCAERGPESVPLTPSTESMVSAPPAAAVVGRNGSTLLLRGQPWWPAGFNAPQLATNWAINIGCGAQVDLDDYFGKLPPNALTRVGIFQALAVDKSTGRLDFSAADAVFAAAQRHGQLILPVLVPQNGDCDDQTFKQRSWYVTGWTETTPIPGRNVLSAREWITTAVNRWRSSPVLAGWEVVGEPEPSMCGAGNCSERARSCPRDAAVVLRRFMDDSGALIRSLDPQRLIFAGFIGGGQCGTAGTEYVDVGMSPQIDVLEYHDYSDDDVALPGDQRDGLATRLRQARELGKPLLVAEIGEHAGSCRSLSARRDSIATSMAGQRAAGSAGALVWAFVPDPRPEQCTFDVGPEDPLWSLIAERITVG